MRAEFRSEPFIEEKYHRLPFRPMTEEQLLGISFQTLTEEKKTFSLKVAIAVLAEVVREFVYKPLKFLMETHGL
jgi:hypothetical protein